MSITQVSAVIGNSWDLGLPWWNRRAITWLERHLPDGPAFEWGSGGSTVWLAGHGLDVTAIESEPDWAQRVRQRVPAADVRCIPGAEQGLLRSEPELRDRGLHYFDDYVAAIDAWPLGSLGLVIIDGICRAECAHRAVARVRPGGIAVVDDSQWAFLRPALLTFTGWEPLTIGGLKDGALFSTSFFRRPAPR